jgi:hypothetical protein
VKIEQHPELTLEEMDDRKTHEKYGITNNFWNYFFPELTDDLRHILLEGSLKKLDHRSAKLLFWEQKGILISAFKRVGFERIRRMHESIKIFLELDAEWKRRVGDNPMRICYGHRRIPESALIPEEEKKRYTKAEIDFENTLRVLALELYKEGVPFLDIHG